MPVNRSLSIAGIAIAVALSMLFLDRPLADWSNARFPWTPLFRACLAFFYLIDALGILGIVLLVIGTGARLLRTKLPHVIEPLQPVLIAALVTLILTELLKFGFGRSWIGSYVGAGVFEFRPFTYGHGYGAFPSAKMSVSTAFFAAVNPPDRAGQIGAVVALAGVAAALVVTNGHWMSDIIGGTALGYTVATALRKTAPSWPSPFRR